MRSSGSTTRLVIEVDHGLIVEVQRLLAKNNPNPYTRFLYDAEAVSCQTALGSTTEVARSSGGGPGSHRTIPGGQNHRDAAPFSGSDTGGGLNPLTSSEQPEMTRDTMNTATATVAAASQQRTPLHSDPAVAVLEERRRQLSNGDDSSVAFPSREHARSLFLVSGSCIPSLTPAVLGSARFKGDRRRGAAVKQRLLPLLFSIRTAVTRRIRRWQPPDTAPSSLHTSPSLGSPSSATRKTDDDVGTVTRNGRGRGPAATAAECE
ncbi:uncharacterized protein LOC110265901 [Arachis ipaensis]|uniref:uncharacterized protein LOC110265901 n=1 Tax=Arachis ipaensis TaxID=130454 RepID=UPI000A2B595B|nr:uncharacterized protein LOC110265901 [Arachis ipaensis]